jgi:hypothetical protein
MASAPDAGAVIGPFVAERRSSEITGQIQERRDSAPERLLDARAEDGREPRDLGQGPARDHQDSHPHLGLDREEDGSVDTPESGPRSGLAPARVRNAVAVDVDPPFTARTSAMRSTTC